MNTKQAKEKNQTSSLFFLALFLLCAVASAVVSAVAAFFTLELHLSKNQKLQVAPQLAEITFERLTAWAAFSDSAAKFAGPTLRHFLQDEMQTQGSWMRFNESCGCYQDEVNHQFAVRVPATEFPTNAPKRPNTAGNWAWSMWGTALFSSCAALILFFLRDKPIKNLILFNYKKTKDQTLTMPRLKDFLYFTLRVTRTISNPFVSHQSLVALELDVFRQKFQRQNLAELENAFVSALLKICEHGPLPSVYRHPGANFPVFLIHCPNYDSINSMALVSALREEFSRNSGVSEKADSRFFCAGIAVWEHGKTVCKNEHIETREFVRGALGALKRAQETGLDQTFIQSFFEDVAESAQDGQSQEPAA